MAPAVSIVDARLDYDGIVLFDGLSMTVAGGRITALLGPSGIGKTSLLRLIAGLAPVGESGRVSCDDGGGVAGRVAYMAQSDLLLPWLNVLDNVALGARLRGEAADKDKARGLLAELGLAGYEAASPQSLSGGMRQRAALARTLMEDRPIVLMDEPFSGLDAITRARLQDLAVTALAGRTVLLVTHDPLEAIRIAAHIEVMAGRPARLGDPLIPPGVAPRNTSTIEITALYGDLMRRLDAATP
jgi:putative hydroxymethylpyrimidine transport system ATP-binding protein